MREALRILALLVFSLLYQTSYVQVFYRILPLDLLSLLVFYASLRWKDLSASSFAFGVGLLKDLVGAFPAGSSSLSLLAASYITRIVRDRTVMASWPAVFIAAVSFFAVEKGIFYLLSALLGLSPADSLSFHVYSSLLTALAAAIFIRRS